MRWLRKDPEGAEQEIAEELRQRAEQLLEKISANFERGEWDRVGSDIVRLMQLYREGARYISVTQSVLAELHGRWGLSLNAARRYDEAFTHLQRAEQLFNMEHDEAVAWAESDGISMEGEGDVSDLRLALEVLRALAEAAIRQGLPSAGRTLAQIVDVADIAGDEVERWEARQRLAAFTAGLADWNALMEVGREMGEFAQQRRSLPKLMEAMRQIVEAYVGRAELDKAVAAQRLVVDIARFLDDPALPDEELELQKLTG